MKNVLYKITFLLTILVLSSCAKYKKPYFDETRNTFIQYEQNYDLNMVDGFKYYNKNKSSILKTFFSYFDNKSTYFYNDDLGVICVIAQGGTYKFNENVDSEEAFNKIYENFIFKIKMSNNGILEIKNLNVYYEGKFIVIDSELIGEDTSKYVKLMITLYKKDKEKNNYTFLIVGSEAEINKKNVARISLEQFISNLNVSIFERSKRIVH